MASREKNTIKRIKKLFIFNVSKKLNAMACQIMVGWQESNKEMTSVNAIGVVIGNPDEIVFVLTKSDVERVHNMMNNLDLGTPLPESVWSAFKNNKHRLDDRLDHAEAIEDILLDYCRPVPTIAPPPPVASIPAPAPSIYDDWDKKQQSRYDTEKFRPPGYGNHVMWSAHRVRSFMKALNLKPTVYDTNLRTLAKIAGVHPYDFRWKTNPVVFGGKQGLSDYTMKCMMGYRVFDQMRYRSIGY